MDLYPLHTQESVGHGRPCVTACGDEHMDCARVILEEMAQHTGHEAGPDILEGEGRAVEQFERPYAGHHLTDGRIERQSAVDNLIECVAGDISVKKPAGHSAAYLTEIHFGEAGYLVVGQRIDAFGHIEPVVGSEPLDNSLAHSDVGRNMVGAVISHVVSLFS